MCSRRRPSEDVYGPAAMMKFMRPSKRIRGETGFDESATSSRTSVRTSSRSSSHSSNRSSNRSSDQSMSDATDSDADSDDDEVAVVPASKADDGPEDIMSKDIMPYMQSRKKKFLLKIIMFARNARKRDRKLVESQMYAYTSYATAVSALQVAELEDDNEDICEAASELAFLHSLEFMGLTDHQNVASDDMPSNKSSNKSSNNSSDESSNESDDESSDRSSDDSEIAHCGEEPIDIMRTNIMPHLTVLERKQLVTIVMYARHLSKRDSEDFEFTTYATALDALQYAERTDIQTRPDICQIANNLQFLHSLEIIRTPNCPNMDSAMEHLDVILHRPKVPRYEPDERERRRAQIKRRHEGIVRRQELHLRYGAKCLADRMEQNLKPFAVPERYGAFCKNPLVCMPVPIYENGNMTGRVIMHIFKDVAGIFDPLTRNRGKRCHERSHPDASSMSSGPPIFGGGILVRHPDPVDVYILSTDTSTHCTRRCDRICGTLAADGSVISLRVDRLLSNGTVRPRISNASIRIGSMFIPVSKVQRDVPWGVTMLTYPAHRNVCATDVFVELMAFGHNTLEYLNDASRCIGKCSICLKQLESSQDGIGSQCKKLCELEE